jgi:hypothetical protein
MKIGVGKPVGLTLALLLVAASAGSAAQTTPTTFGANLAEWTPQSQATCESLYFQPTCTLSMSADALGGTGESFMVPQGPDAHGTGTITAFHLAVGDITGPMQILLLQALRQSANSAACCSVVNATAAFTPRADAITTINVRWPTEADNVPNPDNHVYAFDLMAVSVSAGVPLPVAASNSEPVDTVWAPACPGTVGTECDTYGGDERYVVTMSADWTPDPAVNPVPNPPNPNPPHPVAPSLLPGTAGGVVRGGRVAIPLTCSTAACIGSVQLQNFLANATAVDAQRSRHVTYGRATFSLAAGQRRSLHLHLDRAGRRLLAHRRRAAVWLNVDVQGGSRLSRRFVLRRPGRR